MHRDRVASLQPHGRSGGNEPVELSRLPQTLRAYRVLRRRILDNEMPPNAQYLEQELANALGMSRTPVREALIRLSEERLVEIRPRHGARVLPVSVDDMREIYEMMTELEALAARCSLSGGVSESCDCGSSRKRLRRSTVECRPMLVRFRSSHFFASLSPASYKKARSFLSGFIFESALSPAV